MLPIFFSPLLFKKTQIQLHSLKTTTLTINLSLFNIISVHFHRFDPPFNKGMYSSPVKSKVLSLKPLMHGRFHILSFSFFTATYPSSNSADIHCCIPIHIFQPFMYANGHFTFCSQEFNHRTLSNTMGCSAAICCCRKLLLQWIGQKVWGILPNAIFFLTNVFQKKKRGGITYWLTLVLYALLLCSRGEDYQ